MAVNPGAPASSASISGSVAVYFDPATPSVAATFSAASLEVVPTTGSRIMYDAGHQAERVLIVGSQANASLQVVGITNSIQVHILSTNGTMAVNLGKTDGTITVRTDPSYELGSVRGINSSVAVHLLSTGGTIHTYLDPGTTLEGIQSSIAVHLVGTGGTIHTYLDPGTTLEGIQSSVAVYFDRGKPSVLADTQGTASLFTASGSASGVSVSGNTIISPSANYSFKIYAYSIQTTGLVSLATKFTNGAGTTPTEFWRPLITANQSSSIPQGANLSSAGPGSPLFVTGTSTTLSLVLDSATLVHYSVAYTKESA